MAEFKTSGFAYQIMDLVERAIFAFAKDDYQVVYANARAKEMFGDKIMDVTCFRGLIESQTPCEDCPFAAIKNGEEFIVERDLKALDLKVGLKATAVTWEDGREVIFCIILDTDEVVWENKKIINSPGTCAEKLKYLSEFDQLTNIPNSGRFYMDVEQVLAKHPKRRYAIISFDINKFKLINDLFGMSTGDSVLKHVASVFGETLPENALYCRMHSDVFFICIPFLKRGEIIKLIEKVRKGIDRNEFSFDINTTFGIYLIEDKKLPVNLMCDRATLAGKTVKENAMSFCAFYDEQYRDEIIRNKEIEQDMSLAIADQQFKMYLQPKYDLASGEVCGAEVLSRWEHPTKGLIQPSYFIPLFERNGFILKLDEYMWEMTCKTIARWHEEGRKTIPLSVNISRCHLKNNNLVHIWKDLIRKYQIPTSEIVLEITETFFYDSDDLYKVLNKLRKMGFQLELDDFGAGYSSLNMIRRAPIDTIKIDRDFLDQKLATDKGKIVISHTIAMAKDLNLGVIAEGVETKEHVEFLKSSDCDIAQGYFFAKPMPLEKFEDKYLV